MQRFLGKGRLESQCLPKKKPLWLGEAEPISRETIGGCWGFKNRKTREE